MRVCALGVRRLLVLDLERVGIGTGIGTEALCESIKQSCPGLEVWAGGGVRDAGDLSRLREAGVEAALVASALHDEAITPRQIEALRRL